MFSSSKITSSIQLMKRSQFASQEGSRWWRWWCSNPQIDILYNPIDEWSLSSAPAWRRAAAAEQAAMVLVVNAPHSLLFIQSTTSSSGRGAITGSREHKQQLIPKIRFILAIWVKKGCGLVRDLTSKIIKKRTFEDSYKLLLHHHQLRRS